MRGSRFGNVLVSFDIQARRAKARQTRGELITAAKVRLESFP